MPKRNLAWIAVIGVIALLFWRLPQQLAGRDVLWNAFGPLVEARAEVLRNAAEPVDEARLVTAASRAGIEAMLRELGDPFAVYLDPVRFREFQKQTQGVFAGIGVDVQDTPDGLRILSRMRHGPAARGDLRPGDLITAIDGEPVKTLDLVDSIGRLNGPPDSQVTLSIRRGTEAFERPLTRATIEINPVRGWSREAKGGWRFMLDAERGVGYVRLVKFLPNAAQALDAAIDTMLAEGMRGLVLDLRENTGGLLWSAIDVADRFLEKGLIVATRGRKSDAREWMAQPEGTYRPFKLLVLINRSTASAAEIVAGALQDHHRATIVGERSYGKGSVQELIPLSDGQGALKLTTGYYYLPSGRCLQRRPESDDRWGVDPDLAVELPADHRDRWLRIWHRAGLELVEDTVDTADLPTAATTAAAETALTDLLGADPQLRAALDLLRRHLTATQPGGDLAARRAPAARPWS